MVVMKRIEVQNDKFDRLEIKHTTSEGVESVYVFVAGQGNGDEECRVYEKRGNNTRMKDICRNTSVFYRNQDYYETALDFIVGSLSINKKPLSWLLVECEKWPWRIFELATVKTCPIVNLNCQNKSIVKDALSKINSWCSRLTLELADLPNELLAVSSVRNAETIYIQGNFEFSADTLTSMINQQIWLGNQVRISDFEFNCIAHKWVRGELSPFLRLFSVDLKNQFSKETVVKDLRAWKMADRDHNYLFFNHDSYTVKPQDSKDTLAVAVNSHSAVLLLIKTGQKKQVLPRLDFFF